LTGNQSPDPVRNLDGRSRGSVDGTLLSRFPDPEWNWISFVLKKTFKAVTVFCLLVGCYFGYVQVFAILVRQMTSIRRTKGPDVWIRHDSDSRRASIRLAKSVMPPGHWSTGDHLNFRYYSAERGYYMYAQEMEQIQEENGVRYDGKRLRLTPFLAIMTSRDGRKIQTITSDRAIIDLNQPLGFNAGPDGEALKVKHVLLEPNVVIHDNKSTPNIAADDMTIDQLTTLEYDEPTQRITSESHVVIQDSEMVTSGDGLLVQLCKSDESTPGDSSGFDGVEYLELFRNVHVIMHDVGKSDMMPGAKAPRQRPAKTTVEARPQIVNGQDAKALATPEQQPTPLDLTCDSKMRVFPAKTRAPVLVGPPAPPLPTLVTFDRNVVVLRGRADEQPGQLTCDNLKLMLVPSEEPPPQSATAQPVTGQKESKVVGSEAQLSSVAAKTSIDNGSRALAQANSSHSPDADDKSNSAGTLDKTTATEKSGLFGGLTLKRAHATGHAVWLYLPADGIKLRCNELIHMRQAPEKQDLTYFRGDLTRPLELEKIDLVQDIDSPDHGKVKSITHIRTIDATTLDKGFGFDSADVVATGPGRLDIQPGRGQPIGRSAIWQDKLTVQNEVDTDGKIKQKIILLTGDRPVFMDNSRGSSIDSAKSIRVWLLPKSVQASKDAGIPEDAPAPEDSSIGGGGFDIKRLLAFCDVHLLAPAKTMIGREFVDAVFIQSQPVPVSPDVTSPVPANAEDVASGAAKDPVPAENQVAANAEEPKKSSEPLMTGSADRIWVEIEMMPKSPAQTADRKETAQTKTTSTIGSKPSSSDDLFGDQQSEIRKARLWGSVAIHQDPAEGKTKGQDAFGEAIYLDNPAKNKSLTYVYQRNPLEAKPSPGPLPPARVENDEKTITATGGAGVIVMNQGTDQAWVEGPGVLTQLATRTTASPAAPPAPTVGPKTTSTLPSRATTSRTLDDEPLATSLLVQTDVPQANARGQSKPASPIGEPSSSQMDPQDTSPDQPVDSKPKTRAGRPLSEKVLSTIHFSEGMEFNGKSIDPDNKPAGRADFYGIATALLEDALLRGEEGIIAYTDRPVPFAQLGALNKAKSKNGEPTDAEEGDDKPADEGPQLAIIECYRNAIGISRKVDPDRPEVLQQQRIEATELLVYDRRTGNFHVPGKGKVYLYDRSDNSRAQGMNLDGGNPPNTKPAGTERTVTPTSRRSSIGTTRSTTVSSARSRTPTQPQHTDAPADAEVSELPPLVLTQIHFLKGMRGRFGSTNERDPTEVQWYEFFGDIQLARAKAASPQSMFNFDKLPADRMFLTSQTLRVRTEPPPVGSPPSTPARDYVKAWERAYVHSSDKSLQADVITYDSEKDQVYAFGEGGRGVIYAQQLATGQPDSQGLAKAVRLNPRTGAAHFAENSTIQFIDQNSGSRPQIAPLVDPDFKKKKPPKKGFRISSSSVERRGFTGQ
jgi:hypothetical protein